MEATKILVAEHDVILRVIAALDVAITRLAQGEPVRPGFFLDAVDFIKGYADGCHHNKEEGLLFPALKSSGIPVQGGPIGVMLAEHEQGRYYTRAMLEAAQNLEEGSDSAQARLIEAVQGYSTLLKLHIEKENNILFPMADRFILPSDQSSLNEAFERAGEEESGDNVHEKYHALASAIEQEASGSSGPR